MMKQKPIIIYENTVAGSFVRRINRFTADVYKRQGFVCIAGMEAVAEHSLMHQFGTGRPDRQDEKELLEFATKIMESVEIQRTPKFPGNRPYREYGGVPLKPVANGKCTSCDLCAKECPTGAIPLNNPKLKMCIRDRDKKGLYAWNGFGKVAPAVEG